MRFRITRKGIDFQKNFGPVAFREKHIGYERRLVTSKDSCPLVSRNTYTTKKKASFFVMPLKISSWFPCDRLLARDFVDSNCSVTHEVCTLEFCRGVQRVFVGICSSDKGRDYGV